MPGLSTITPNSEYVQDLKDHIEHFRNHARGVDVDIWGTDDLEASVVPPATHWSPDEKRRLFYGLTRYSRLRPDLISDHIGTKTATQVYVYLDMLEAATQQVEPEAPVSNAAISIHPKIVAFEDRQADVLRRMEEQVEGLSASKRVREVSSSDDEENDDARPAKRLRTRDTWLDRQRLMAMERLFTAYHPEPDRHLKKRESKPPAQRIADATEELEDLGIVDAGQFVAHGLDVLRPRQVAALLTLYASPTVRPSPPVVSLDVLVSLRKALIEWLLPAIHHIVSFYESLVESRGPSTHFKRSGEHGVDRDTVKQALAIFGHDRTRRAVFQNIPEEYKLAELSARQKSKTKFEDTHYPVEEEGRTAVRPFLWWHPQTIQTIDRGEEEADGGCSEEQSDSDNELGEQDRLEARDEYKRLKSRYQLKHGNHARKGGSDDDNCTEDAV